MALLAKLSFITNISREKKRWMKKKRNRIPFIYLFCLFPVLTVRLFYRERADRYVFIYSSLLFVFVHSVNKRSAIKVLDAPSPPPNPIYPVYVLCLSGARNSVDYSRTSPSHVKRIAL
ncbi:hypothetical protein CEXT_158591 [Caerostris extrusa]|uniref:Uncharacterized protein n=1 Tax=Caerostris extrusa TaxID=172846 RepID=A0AAV4UKM7_CAEEX|nr:hypothetical protein CEXT_158591 [Caerostris extrusa]